MKAHVRGARALSATAHAVVAAIALIPAMAFARPTNAAAPAPAPSASTTATPPTLSSMRLYVNPSSPAARQADQWRRSRPADAALMSYIAEQPTATWFGDWNSDIRGDVDRLTSSAVQAGTVPVLVAYDIPNRDCGSYSAGGARDAASYARWIQGMADGLRGRPAVVILEPDAVAGSSCLSASAQSQRFGMLRGAVETLKGAGAHVYLDAGNAHWVGASEMASRLRQAGIDEADGFALNVSNYFSTSDNTMYGASLSRLLGGKHFVIDTSRNGTASANGQWCNPAGQALGAAPTTRTGNALVDALLWIKQPGESDGTCNGGPTAGQWWADYALGLARRSGAATAAATNNNH